MTERHPRHRDRARALRDALADVLAEGAVDIGFQPVVELATDNVVGWEALARGPHGTQLEYPDRLFEAARAAPAGARDPGRPPREPAGPARHGAVRARGSGAGAARGR